jgi:phosphatidylglycerophosphatase C
MSTEKGLVLWDFDGTLYQGDSFLDFLCYTHRLPARAWRWLCFLPFFITWKIGLRSAADAKESLFGLFYKNWSYARFVSAATAFQTEKHPPRLHPLALAKITAHKAEGHRQIILSATMEELLQVTASRLGVEVIGTQVHTEGSKLSGRFASPNCNGLEKVVRLRAFTAQTQPPVVHAYGNSPGDAHMLALAEHPHYRTFARGVGLH